MKTRPLIIGPEARERIKAVKEYARAHRIALAELQRLAAAQTPVGDEYPGGRLVIPVGYRVYFSIEEHPAGWCYHISISVAADGLWPNPLAVGAILSEFEIEPGLSTHYNEERCQAVNFIQPIGIEDARARGVS